MERVSRHDLKVVLAESQWTRFFSGSEVFGGIPNVSSTKMLQAQLSGIAATLRWPCPELNALGSDSD